MMIEMIVMVFDNDDNYYDAGEYTHNNTLYLYLDSLLSLSVGT